MALTKIDDRGLKTPVDLLDDEKIRFGTGNDLEIYHDGSHSYIKNNTGDLILRDDTIELKAFSTTDAYLTATNGGAVTIRHDNSVKFETTSYGNASAGQIRVTASNATTPAFSVGDSGTGFYNAGTNAIGYSANGTQKWHIDSAGNLRFLNDVHAHFGTNINLKIFHSGADGRIRNTTGTLCIDTLETNGEIRFTSDNVNKNMIRAVRDAQVELYHNDGKKLSTTANGIEIHDLDDTTAQAKFHAQDWNSGGSTVGSVYGNSATSPKEFGLLDASGEWAVLVKDGAGVGLYYDGSAAAKLETTSYGVFVGATFRADVIDQQDNKKILIGNDDDLEIYHDGSHSYIKESGTGNLQIVSNQTNIQDADLSHYQAKFIDGGAVELYHNGGLKAQTYTEGLVVEQFLRVCSADSDSHWGVAEDNTNNWSLMQSQEAQPVLILENSHDSTPNGLYIYFSDDAPDDSTQYAIHFDDNAAARFAVRSDGDVWTSDSGILTSDETLKENIVDATPKLEDIKKLKVRNFNWKSSFHPEKSKKKQLGFIAQEVEEVFPSLVNEYDIAPRAGIGEDDHVPVMKKAIKAAWDPIIIKAMQELIAKVETLETEVAALKAK